MELAAARKQAEEELESETAKRREKRQKRKERTQKARVEEKKQKILGFSNDGSFLEQFKKMQEEQKKNGGGGMGCSVGAQSVVKLGQCRHVGLMCVIHSVGQCCLTFQSATHSSHQC